MNFLGKTAIAVLRVLGRPAVWIPALIMLAGTILFAATDLDTALLRPYFSDNPDAATLAARWPQRHSLLWRWLYDWGVYPARVLGVGGLAVWLAGGVLVETRTLAQARAVFRSDAAARAGHLGQRP